MPAGKWNAWIRGRGASGEAAWWSCWEWIPVTTGFGELLRWHRGAAGLTQEELAGRSGVSVRAIADMERGRTGRPYRRSVSLLADALLLTGQAREELPGRPGRAPGVSVTCCRRAIQRPAPSLTLP